MSMEDLTPANSRDWFSSVVGLLVLAGSGYILITDLVPWYAALATAAVGLYLALPNRMKFTGGQVVDLINRIRHGNGK